MEDLIKILAILVPTAGAIIVEIIKSRKLSKQTLEVVTAMQKDIPTLKSDISLMKSASRTGLQTQILEKSKWIQLAIKDGEKEYDEELKQLIILFKEYHACGFNSQGKIYFNDTLRMAAEHNSVLVHDLMNTLFPDYDPD